MLDCGLLDRCMDAVFKHSIALLVDYWDDI